MIIPDRELALFRMLREARARLEQVRDPIAVMKFAARATHDFFDDSAVCAAVRGPADVDCEIVGENPPGGGWNRNVLSAFVRGGKPDLPPDVVLAPIRRKGRSWGVLAVRRAAASSDREIRIGLARVAETVAQLIAHIDAERVREIRARIDRKIMELLRPRDLFYQILQGLRSLTGYDHSSALLVANSAGGGLEVAAEQIAYTKGRSSRIGLKLPLTDEARASMTGGGVYLLDRAAEGWCDAGGRDVAALATLLDYNRPAADDPDRPCESSILCAPLATREGVIGAIKLAGIRGGTFGAYEAEVVQHFTSQASVAIQYQHRTESLHSQMVEAERKHAVATMARGVSHDVNNALGSVLPLVQQMLADIQSGRVDPEPVAADLKQIEHSVQVCRRIFGGMLSFARASARKLGQGNVRRAIEGTMAILADGMQRRGIQVEIALPDNLGVIRCGQSDLEQLFLNLVTNARDAMPSGGKLSVRAAPLAQMVEVTIEDTGCGIAAEHLERVAEPFFTTKHDGNGLGLSICRSIMWEMQSDLEIHSEAGNGTRVKLVLPTVRESRGES